MLVASEAHGSLTSDTCLVACLVAVIFVAEALAVAARSYVRVSMYISELFLLNKGNGSQLLTMLDIMIVSVRTS